MAKLNVLKRHRVRTNNPEFYQRLQKARAQYPHRLVRDHTREPRPDKIDETLTLKGHHAKFPMRDGDEWLFEHRSDLDQFHAKYGGTIIG